MKSWAKIALSVVIAAMIAVAGSPSSYAQYATEVVDFSATAPAGAEGNVLGAPDCSNAQDFNNVGSVRGFVTVAFGATISDGPGDDVFVHLHGFQPFAQFNESFRVLASEDGIVFVEIGSENPDDYNYAPLDEVAFGFDLADGALTQATQIKVENLSLETGTNSEGPDLCGFEYVPIPVPASSLRAMSILGLVLLIAVGVVLAYRRSRQAAAL